MLALLCSFIFTAIVSFFIKDNIQLSRFGAVVVAPIVEEITKGLFLLITITNKKFDNITDGIVYGGAIGLGFGMTENFLYFVTYGDSVANWMMLVVIRSLFSAVMHCVSTATLGAFLGLAKFKSSPKKISYTIAGLTFAMMIHSIWNISLSYDNIAPIGFLFMLVAIIIFISVFSISLRGERKIIFNELREESENGIIPESHLIILSSPQRERKGWLDERNRKAYIKAATTLAFRKVQLKTQMVLAELTMNWMLIIIETLSKDYYKMINQ
ncbi:MAG: PrsW family intramembrane metalloprotease [Ignavibacteriales bacterium]|nr:PrsW family intramembrane metalloprotease [Ignavibacteriales bacterium]